MECIIENEYYKIIANTHGGNIKHIISKKYGEDYLWKGRPFVWKLDTDVLFPVICKVKDWIYRYQNKEYFMPVHGFASRTRYKLIEYKDDVIAFELKNTSESEQIYPFKFSLINKYELKGREIVSEYTVKNTDDKELYFNLGVHPSFACPMYGAGDDLEDYYLKFEKKEEKATILEINDNDYLTGNEKIFKENFDEILINDELFKDGTKIFNNLESNKVTLASRKHNRSITVDFEEFNILSLWGPDRMVDFICIEPWNGHADLDSFTGEISEKEGIIKLLPGQEKKFKYTIKINE